MLTWVVSGNCPIVWVCVLGSVLLTAHLSLLPPQSSWSILSVKVHSLTHALWHLWYVQLHAGVPSRAQHPDAPLPHAGSRRCLRWFTVLRSCTVHWLLPHWFVKPLRLSPRTTVTSSVKKKKRITSLLLMDISVVLSSNMHRSTTPVHCTSSSLPGLSWVSGLPPSASAPWRSTSTI